MRDWQAYARDQLGWPRLRPGEEDDVAVELAAHLEDFYADLRIQGIPDEEAFAQTCARAGNWQQLRKEIVDATQEESMHDRIKQIWLPALATFISSYLVLVLLERARIRPPFERSAEPHGAVYFLPWLLLLPLIGAASAYLSRRAQGRGWRVYLGASFPVLVLAVLLLILFSSIVAQNPHGLQTKANALLASCLVGWHCRGAHYARALRCKA